MSKTILLTGATDGIGLETAKRLVTQGYSLLVHGRNAEKLTATMDLLSQQGGKVSIESFQADLSRRAEVEDLASRIRARHSRLDIIINNAGVYKTAGSTAVRGIDLRILVNTVAPYLLTRQLLPLMPANARVINLSSAAQAPVDPDTFFGEKRLADDEAYAQSKLALTMWTFHLASELGSSGPAVIAVNPASLLATKMVKEAYGLEGNDLGIGAEILVRASLDEEFANASGLYYDNDQRCFADPHPQALNPEHNKHLVMAMDQFLMTNHYR